MYEIIQKLIKNNRSGKGLKPVGIVVHDTATPGATAQNEHDYFNNAYRGASAHAFTDWTSIVQTVPFAEVAWHAGGTANSKFIGVELCVPNPSDTGKFSEVWKRATWLFAYVFVNVLKCTTVSKENLMSHAEVSAKWKETDHTDPISFFGLYGKTVTDFRRDVQTEIINMTKKDVGVVAKTWEQETGEKAIDILHEKGEIENPEQWKEKDLKTENVPLWLFFEMLNRALDGK